MAKIRRQERWIEDDFTVGKGKGKGKEIEQTGGVINMLPPNVKVEIYLHVSSSDPVRVFNELWEEGAGRFISHPEHIPVKVTQFRADRVNQGADSAELFHNRKLCAVCGKMFKPVHEGRAIYCSTSCRGKAYYQRKKGKSNGSEDKSE